MAESLLATVALAVLAMAAAGYLAQRLRAPPTLGYLAAGILLSPAIIGNAYWDTGVMTSLADVGVLFLLFLVGLELDLARLRRVVRATAWAMPFDLLVPLVLVGGAARIMGWTAGQALGLGAAVALSSTLLGERLTSPRDFGGDARTRVLGILVSEDVAAGALIALLTIAGSGAGAGAWTDVALEVGRLLFFLVLLTALAVAVVPRVLDAVARRHVHELVVLWGIGVVVLWGYLGHLAGSAELGAFVAGVAAAEAGSRYVARNALHTVRDAAVALFFFASGLGADVVPVLRSPWLALAVAFLFLTAKTVVHLPAALAAGLDLRSSLRTAFALGTLGEFSLILVAVATRAGIAHARLAGTVVVAMLVVLPLAAALVGQADRVARGIERAIGPWRGGLETLVRGMRRTRADPTDPSRRKAALRRLGANLLLLTTWGLAAVAAMAWANVELAPRLPWIQVAGWAAALALALPLLRGVFRSYRDLVWTLVGLRPGERVGAGRVRMRLVDATVALTALPFLAILALTIPATVPVLVAATVLAAVVGTLAWRRLASFHRTLEHAMGRVLGDDPAAGRLLDHVLREYPWGVRSVAVAVPPQSPVAGRTIRESGIARASGAMIGIIQRRRRELVGPGPEELLLAGDTLLLLGDAHQLERAEALIVSSGEALPMTAQTMDAGVEDVPIEEGMACVGRTLGDLDLRNRTGTLIVGHWAVGGRSPRRFEASRRVQAGDRLLLLGTPLQVQRAVDLLRAPPGPTEED